MSLRRQPDYVFGQGGIFIAPAIEVPGPRITLLSINQFGILSVLYGLPSVYTQTFYLTSPDSTSWQVLCSSATGSIIITSGIPNLGIAGWAIDDELLQDWTLAISDTGVLTATL